jgi:hypothetical protein
MKNGGKRPGAGRKKGSKAQHTIQAEAAKAYLINRFLAEKEPIVTALLASAMTGNVPAIKELFERVWGKVPATLEADATGELFQIIIKRKDE